MKLNYTIVGTKLLGILLILSISCTEKKNTTPENFLRSINLPQKKEQALSKEEQKQLMDTLLRQFYEFCNQYHQTKIQNDLNPIKDIDALGFYIAAGSFGKLVQDFQNDKNKTYGAKNKDDMENFCASTMEYQIKNLNQSKETTSEQ